VKFAEPRPFSDPEAAVRKLIEIANAAEAVQDARIYIERVNGLCVPKILSGLVERRIG
jgi:hypothetical protein